MNIQMVDLRGQYEKIQSEIDTAINSTLDSCRFVRGVEIEDFEHALAGYLGVRHVIAVGSGTDALTLAYLALGLQPGDEVIVPDFTFVAAAEAAALLHLRPVLVDCDYDTMTISPDAIRRAVSPHTRAIVPVHLFGHNADMDAIMAIAREHNLAVVEDAAQSLGSFHISSDGSQHQSGTMGHIGCTSFFPTKNLGCYGDGGALFTDDDRLAATIRSLANHGMTIRYRYDHIGVNSRLDTIQAAILLAKLPHLDDYIAARQHAASCYNALLASDHRFLLPAATHYSTHSYHQYTLRCTGIDRDTLRRHLTSAGIPTMIYYPQPLHTQPVYHDTLRPESDFPNSNALAHQVLSLPMHTELTEEQILYITDRIKQFN